MAREAGLAPPRASALLTSGRVLAAIRRGRPLSYACVEGLARCERCGIERGARDDDPRLRPHRRLRAVVVSSTLMPGPIAPIEVPEGAVLTVERSLATRLEAL